VTPWLSVVVPTLNEEAHLAATLDRAAAPGVERIVVDGGSTDGTLGIARHRAERLLEATRGRALQMNAGANVARGETLLFLHADTLLPADYAACVAAALRDPGVVGGRFDVRLDAPGWIFGLIGALISARSRLTRVATGDQAIFVRTAQFHRLGGFPRIPLMEDVALSRALKRVGRVACLRAAVTTSARRWQRHGIARTVILMWTLRLLYVLGVPPRTLRRTYGDTR
jgi:rSAM/selenodomain-associated transferase 2